MNKLKHKIEALLFSSGRAMSVVELKKLTRGSPEEIVEAINEIKEDLKARNSSILLIDETPESWKLTVQNDHIPLVRKIVSKTELKKSLLETLAIISWKAPVLQSDIVKVRTNKAYGDLRDLESMNYISRSKKGRTKLIKLAPKFFEYFDIPPEKVKERFARFDQLESEILHKEKEADEAKKKLGEVRKIQEEEQKKIDRLGSLEIIDEPKVDVTGDPDQVQEYGESASRQVSIVKETMGSLEIIEEPEKASKKVKARSSRLGIKGISEQEEETSEEGKESEEEPEQEGSEETEEAGPEGAEEQEPEEGQEEKGPEDESGKEPEQEEPEEESREGEEDQAESASEEEPEETEKEPEIEESPYSKKKPKGSEEVKKEKSGEDAQGFNQIREEEDKKAKELIAQDLENSNIDKEIETEINKKMDFLLHPEKAASEEKKEGQDKEEEEKSK